MAPDPRNAPRAAASRRVWGARWRQSRVWNIGSWWVGVGCSDCCVFYVAANGAIAAGYVDTAAQNCLFSCTFPTTNAWHHFAYTYDGSTQQLYLDGSSAGSAAATSAIGFDTHPLLLGADIDNESTTSFFPGKIDEVAMFDRVLTSAEVQSIFGAGTFGKCYVPAPAPTITGFAPGSGNTGAIVVISGTDFTAVSAVNFNSVPATFTGNSSSQITATVPAAATTGTISIVAGGGTAISGSAFTVLTAVHWINSSGGNWNTASNWSSGSVPTASNDVVIDASGTYTVDLDVNPAFNTLTIGGGATGTQTLSNITSRDINLTSASSVASNGVLTLSSGRLLGPGALTVNGALNWTADSQIFAAVNVAAAGSLNISGGGTRYADGGTINNSGTINWSGANNISLYNGALISNLTGANFNITNDQQIYQHCCGGSLGVNNAGTITKSVATGATTIQIALNNSGTVDAQSGSIHPRAGTNSGVFHADAPGAIVFDAGTYTAGAGSTFTGNGGVQLTGGGTLTLSGTPSVPSGGAFTWNGDGVMNGNGTLNVNSGGTVNISGGGTRYLDTATIANSGTVNWSGANNITIYNAALFSNLAGGLFSVTSDQTIFQHCCGAGQAFNNAGTFNNNGATAHTLTVSHFTNTGQLNINGGSLTLPPGDGFVDSGNIALVGGVTLGFDGSPDLTGRIPGGGNLTGARGTCGAGGWSLGQHGKPGTQVT